MRESLNLAAAGINTCNSRAAVILCHAIGHRTLTSRGGIDAAEGNEVTACIYRKPFRSGHGIAYAIGAGVRVSVLEIDGSPLDRRGGETRAGSQKSGVRGLRRSLKVGAEGDHLGRPRLVA